MQMLFHPKKIFLHPQVEWLEEWRTVNWQVNPFILFGIIFSALLERDLVHFQMPKCSVKIVRICLCDLKPRTPWCACPPAANGAWRAVRLSLPITSSSSIQASCRRHHSFLLQTARGVWKHTQASFQNIFLSELALFHIHIYYWISMHALTYEAEVSILPYS